MATRKDHPLPAMIMHWIHLISMIVLGTTGFYIHYPFTSSAGAMGLARQLHFIFMYIVILNLIVRIYWAFLGAGSAAVKGGPVTRDTRNFWFQKENRGKLLEIAKYYLFLRKTHPSTGKYNPLQKITYDFWAILLIAQAMTGFAIYHGKVFGFFDAQSAFGWINTLTGGDMTTRMIHYLIMWVFIITVAIHVYLSLAEDIASFMVMFFWKEKKEGH